MKKLNLLLMFVCVSLFTLNAQTNIALNAVSTHSGGGATATGFGPENYNDDIVPVFTNQPWGWVSTNGWIEYTWPSQVSLNSVVFFKDNRPMTTCDIQYWDGTQYVSFFTYNNTVPNYDSISFPTVTTTRLRFNQVAGSSNPNHREIRVYNTVQVPDDAGIVRIDSPAVFCSGPQPVYATVRNFGSTQINSLNVLWEVNGVSQTTLAYTGLIDTINGANPSEVLVSLGTFTFPQGLNDLRVWTSNPNGIADTVNTNDTLLVKVGPALNGNFTIDAALPASGTNFTSFSSAATALNTFGVCGPTYISVAPGVYDDVFDLQSVPGLSAVNTLTVDGGDSTLVTLENDLANSTFLIGLSDISYTTIKNLTVSTNYSGTQEHFGVHLTSASNYDSIVNVHVILSPTQITYGNGIAASNSRTDDFAEGDNANFTTVMGCYSEGGSYGYHFEGGTAGSWNVGNKFMNNTAFNMDDYGFYFDEQDSLEVVGNTTTGNRGAGGDGIYGFDCMNVICNENYVHAPDYGIYFSDFNSDRTPDRRAQVINNMVISDTDYGIYLLDALNVDIIHNSVYVEGSTEAMRLANGLTDNIDLRNNALYSLSSIAFETAEPDTIFLKMDNNVYFTGGATLLDIDGTLYTDLASYQVANTALNGASLEGDPEFLSTTDLHVVGGFMNNVGDNSVNVFVDIDGDTRPIAGATTVDIGADEFNPPSCLPVTNQSATNSSLDSVTIFWDGTAGLYQYEIVSAGAGQGAAGSVLAFASSDSLRIGGLTASTCYDYYVRQVCGRSDTSFWVGPLTFCTANGLPFFEDFESFPQGTNANPWPKGWSSSTTADPRWIANFRASPLFISGNTGPSVDHTLGTNQGLYVFMETSGGAVGATADFESPDVFINPSATTFELSYWYFMYGANIDKLEVYVESNGVQTLINTITGQQQTSDTEPWRQAVHSLTGYAGQSVRVIFRGYNVACCTGDIAIDDIEMKELAPINAALADVQSPQLPICPGPTTPVVGVRNAGTQDLTSVKVVSEVNGILDTTLFTGTITPGTVAPVTLSTFVVNSGVSYDVTFYTIEPNGIVDPIPADDTLRINGLETGLAAGTYTIDSSIVTGGTNYQSFTDFSAAVDNFGLCGPIVVNVAVGSGPYTNQRLILDEVQGSSAANSITINGNGETMTYSTTNNNERSAVYINNTSYVTIDDMVIDASGGTSGWGVHLIGTSSYCSILNSTVDVGRTNTSSFFAGIVMSGSATSTFTSTDVNHITVDNNNVWGGYYSITMYGNATTRMVGNVVTNNSIEDTYNYGIYSFGQDSLLVEGNDIFRPTRTATTTFYGMTNLTNENSLYNANAIHNTHDAMLTNTSTTYPIYSTGDASTGNDNYFTNNVIYNINGNGTIYGIYNLGSDGSNYINNTISLDYAASTSNSVTRGFYENAATSNSSFVNNIVTVSRGGSGVKHGIYLLNATTSIAVDYNDVFMNSAGTGAQFYGRLGAADEATLADWRTNTTYGVNSYDVDPLYNNPAQDSLVPNSGLLNAVALSSPQVTTDFYGVARTSNPDIGAIEFDPPAVPNPGLSRFIAPVVNQDTCYSGADDVVVNLVNAGGVVIDFVTDPTTITVNVSGAITTTISTVINTNAINGGVPLAIGDDIDVTVGTINLNAGGAYSFEGIVDMVADNFPSNDTITDVATFNVNTGGTITGPDTICAGDTATLTADGYQGTLQWQVLVGGVWTDISGETGSSVEVDPTSFSEYRVLACGTAPSDTVSVLPLSLNAPNAFGDSVTVICGGTGTAVATATSANANPTFVWYDAATGGNEITTGGQFVVGGNTDSLYFTATPGGVTTPNSDSVWVSEVSSGGTGGPTLLITEVDAGGPDAIEIHNVSGQAVDVTGWTVAVSNSYTAINNVNATVQTLSGTMTPGQVTYWTDGAVNPWGSNLFWNPGSNSWAIIIDNLGNVVDYIAWDWPAADLLTQSLSINGFTVTPALSGAWNGNGVASAAGSMYRTGTVDNNDATDFVLQPGDFGIPNTGLVTPFAGGGCESPRALALVRVDCIVGLEDAFENTEEFSIYPNPSEGMFTMNITTLANTNFNLTVRDVKGQEVYLENVNVNGAYTESLDFSNYAKGVYYLQIQTEDESRVEKLIIQ